MNPWRQHPAIVGLPIPERYLPPAESWYLASELGLTYPDGVGAPTRRLVAANPRPVHKKMAWAGGPTPDPIKRSRGRMVPVSDAADLVYLWLTEQATLRLDAVKGHLSRGVPSVAEMCHMFNVEPWRVAKWIDGTRKNAARVGGLRHLAIPQPKRFEPAEVRIPKGVTYFVSSTQGSPGEIEGAARLAKAYPGFGVGIEVASCGDPCQLALKLVAKRNVSLFVDSGAFPEFTCMLKAKKKGRDPKACEITHAEWKDRLERYVEISEIFKDRAYLVAPDMIGDQRETARRLNKYGPLLRAAARNKAWVLLVAQGGDRPLYSFWNDMRKNLVQAGIPKKRIVAAFPMKEAATPISELKRFAKKAKDVERYHLLGLGPGGSSFHPALDAIRSERPRSKITCDSRMLKRQFGRQIEYLEVVPKVYTYAQYIVRYEVMTEAFQKSYRGGMSMENWIPEKGWGQDEVPDYTENLDGIDEWLPGRYRLVLADWLKDASRRGIGRRFRQDDHSLLVESPDEWLQSGDPPWYMDPAVDAWLDDQWTRFLGSWFSARVKRDALVMAWQGKASMRDVMPRVEEIVDDVMLDLVLTLPMLRA